MRRVPRRYTKQVIDSAKQVIDPDPEPDQLLASKQVIDTSPVSEPGVVEKKVGVPFIWATLHPDEDNLLALKRPNPVSEWSHDNYSGE